MLSGDILTPIRYRFNSNRHRVLNGRSSSVHFTSKSPIFFTSTEFYETKIIKIKGICYEWRLKPPQILWVISYIVQVEAASSMDESLTACLLAADMAVYVIEQLCQSWLDFSLTNRSVSNRETTYFMNMVIYKIFYFISNVVPIIFHYLKLQVDF